MHNSYWKNNTKVRQFRRQGLYVYLNISKWYLYVKIFLVCGADYETEHCKYLISCKLIICSESIAKGPFYFVRTLVSSIHHIVSFHWSERFTVFYKGVYLPCVFALAELEKITENTRIGKPNSDIPIQFLLTKSHRVWLSFNFRFFGAHHSAIFSTPVLRESF